MAMARASGYSGDDGLVKLLALNQTAKTTASDSATAGNNVVNYCKNYQVANLVIQLLRL
jgi:hypothetical protein